MFQINNLAKISPKELLTEANGKVISENGEALGDSNIFSKELLALLTPEQKVSLPEQLKSTLIKEESTESSKIFSNPDEIHPTLIDNDLTQEVSEILNRQTQLLDTKNVPEEKNINVEKSEILKILKPEFQKEVSQSLDTKTFKENPIGIQPTELNELVLKDSNEETLLSKPTKFQSEEVVSDVFKKPNQKTEKVLSHISSGEDFINQKSLLKNKIAQKNTYASKTSLFTKSHHPIQSEAHRPTDLIAVENSKITNSTQILKPVVSDVLLTTPILQKSSQLFKSDLEAKGSESVKTLNFSDLKTSNTTEIMDQITNYIVQAKASRQESVTLKVNHIDLGMLDITVQKSPVANQDLMSLNIGTQTTEGKLFFQENTKELLAHLNQAGLNILEVKVDQNLSEKKADFDLAGQSKNQNFQNKEFSSEHNQRRHDQNRRQELWNLFKDKEAA